jgi:hypothetical protein
MPEKRDMQRQIEKAKEDGLAKLRELQREGYLTDALYLAAAQRVVSLVLKILLLVDEAYVQVDEYVKRGGQSEHHQASLQDYAAFLLRECQQGISRIVQEAIQNIRSDLPHTRPKVVREVIVQPAPTLGQVLQGFLRENKGILFFLGLCVLGLFSYVVFGIWVAVVVPIVWWVFFRQVPWLVLLPIGLLLLIGVVLVL